MIRNFAKNKKQQNHAGHKRNLYVILRTCATLLLIEISTQKSQHENIPVNYDKAKLVVVIMH